MLRQPARQRVAAAGVKKTLPIFPLNAGPPGSVDPLAGLGLSERPAPPPPQLPSLPRWWPRAMASVSVPVVAQARLLA
jgi:hypothetical protein